MIILIFYLIFFMAGALVAWAVRSQTMLPKATFGRYLRVNDKLANAFPFTILERDGKYFQAHLSKKNFGRIWGKIGDHIWIFNN